MSTRDNFSLNEQANTETGNPDSPMDTSPNPSDDESQDSLILEESPVKKYQTDLCEPVLPIVEEKICPTCIPKPDSPSPPDWKSELNTKPFLNERICEYQIPVMVNEDGDIYTSADIPDFAQGLEKLQNKLRKEGIKLTNDIADIDPIILRDILFRSYVLPGIRLLLRNYNKVETDEYVCTFPPIRTSMSGGTLTDAVVEGAEGAAYGGVIGGLLGLPAGPAGAVVGAKIGASLGALGGLLLGGGIGSQSQFGKQDEVLKLSESCLTVYKMLKSGVLAPELVNQMVDLIEIPTDEPSADPGVVEIPRPSPRFVMAVSKLLSEVKDDGERLFNHEVNVKGLEMYARVVDYDLGVTSGDPIRVLVSVPAFVFDQIPEAPEPEIVDFAGRKEVILKTTRLAPMMRRLKQALNVYGKYQAYWWQTERATLYKTKKRPDGGYSVEVPEDYVSSGEYDSVTDTTRSTITGGAIGSETHDRAFTEAGLENNVKLGTTHDGGDQSIFYIFNYSQRISDFYDELEQLLEQNDYVLSTYSGSFLGLRNVPEEIKLVFGEDDEGLMLIKAVWVKEAHCGWDKLKLGMGEPPSFGGLGQGFLGSPVVDDRTVCGYMAFLNEIDSDLLATETPPWLDFIVQYTYPPLIVKYESETLGPPGLNNPIACIIESGFGDNALRDYLFDEVMSLADALAYQFNKNACKLLLQDEKKSEKDYHPPKIFASKAQRKGLKGIKKHVSFNPEFAEQQQAANQEQLTQNYASIEGQIRAEGQSLKKENFRNESEYKEALASNESDLKKMNLARNNSTNHPFMSLVVADALTEFDLDSSLLAFFVDDMELLANPKSPFSSFTNPLSSPGQSKKSKFTKMLNRLDLCGLSALTLKAIQCLMGGTSLSVAYKAMIKSALNSLDDYNWEKLWVGLPYDKQLEITELVNKQIGELPPPWEWKPGEETKSKKLDKSIIASDAATAATEKYNKAIAKIHGEIEKLKETKINKAKPNAARQQEELNKKIADLQSKLEKNEYQDDITFQYVDSSTTTIFGREVNLQPIDGSDREFNLSQRDLEEIRARVEAHKESKHADPDAKFARSGTLGKSLATVQKALFDAYLEAILDLVSFDYLLAWLDKQPVAKYFINMIANFDCPYPGLFAPPIDSFMATLTLDVCGENKGAIRIPPLPGFGDIGFMSIIRVFADALYKAFWKVCTNIMVKLIVKVLQTLEEAICKSLELAGRLTAGALTPGDQGGFMGALVDTFCGEQDDEEEKSKKAADLLNSLGVKPGDFAQTSAAYVDSYKPLINTMNSLSTKNEYKKLLVSKPNDMDLSLLNRISRAVSSLHPQWAPIFRDPNNIVQIFSAAGNLLSPGQRQALKADLENPKDDVPIEDSVCLTKQELSNWNTNRVKLFTDKGVPKEIAEEWIADQNKKIESDLVELSSIAARGMDSPLKDALDELLNMDNANMDGCEVKSTGLSFSNELTQGLSESQSQGVWKAIGQSFQQDLLGGSMLWNRNSGIIDHILADKEGSPLRKHERRARSNWLYPNVGNSQEDHDNKIALLKERQPDWWVELMLKDDVKAPFPETVGIVLNEQFLKMADEIDIKSHKRELIDDRRQWVYNMEHEGKNLNVYYQPLPFPYKEPDFTFTFQNSSTDDWGYGFELEYSSFQVHSDPNPALNFRTAQQNFDYTIITKIKTKNNAARIIPSDGDIDKEKKVSHYKKYQFNVSSGPSEEVNSLIESYDMDKTLLREELNYQGLCFYSMFIDSWKKIGVNFHPSFYPIKSNIDLVWEKLTNNFYKKTMKCLMRPEDPEGKDDSYIPNSFKFGYEPDSSITFKDLMYVNPNATDDESTWFYDHPEEAKVLGKSATNNPRVHFLNPAQHGGWYSFPKIYVEPHDYEGMLKLAQMMVPEIDACAPKQTDFLHTDDLSNLQQKVSRSLAPDKRLSFKEHCVFKKPFDLIVPPEIHGYIQSTVVATIRVHISDYILRTMPSYGILEFNTLNYDNFISNIIYENMKKDMIDRNPWFGKFIFIKKHVYWYLFLEQVAQIAIRRFKDSSDPLFYENEQIRGSIQAIIQAKKNYASIGLKRVDELINLTNDVYEFSLKGYVWNQELYDDIREKDKPKMESIMPQAGNPVTPGLPWYKQIQHGLMLIEHGPDYKNWIALSSDNSNLNPLLAGAMVTGAYAAGTAAVGATAFSIAAGTTAVAASGAKAALAVATATPVGLAVTAGVLAAGALLVNLADRDGASNFSVALGPHVRWDWKPNLVGSSLYQGVYRKAAKIYSVASVEEECTSLLRVMINEQIDFYAKQLAENKAVKPEITHLPKFVIGAGNGIMFSDELNSGKRKVEVPISATNDSGKSVLSYEELVGNVSNVDPRLSEVTLYEDDPNWDPIAGGMFIQKYIRLIDKEELGDDATNVPKWIKERPDHLRGVVNIEKFKEYYQSVRTQAQEDPNSDLGFDERHFVSQLFGNLSPIEFEETEENPEINTLFGDTIGVRFGVRLMYKPSSIIIPANRNTPETAELSKREKAYFYNDLNNGGLDSQIIPLAIFEKDIIDKRLEEIDFVNDLFLGEDFRCYIDNLAETPQFKLLFEHIFPVKRVSSLMSSYMYMGWFASIGAKAPEERNSAEPMDMEDDETWREGSFDETKNVLYKMFKSYYQTDSWDWEWDWDWDPNFRLWFRDNVPWFNGPNLDGSTTWWQKWRVQKDKPFDKNNQECTGPFGKFFNYG